MITLPAAFCFECKTEMKMELVGVCLEAQISKSNDTPYYKVQTDVHVCPKCGRRIYAGFGRPVERFQPDFATTTTDQVVTI